MSDRDFSLYVVRDAQRACDDARAELETLRGVRDELIRRTLRVHTVHEVAHAMGLSLSQVRRLARRPLHDG
jgi:hypothetical protein